MSGGGLQLGNDLEVLPAFLLALLLLSLIEGGCVFLRFFLLGGAAPGDVVFIEDALDEVLLDDVWGIVGKHVERLPSVVFRGVALPSYQELDLLVLLLDPVGDDEVNLILALFVVALLDV